MDSSFVALALKPRFQESPEYGYGWWLDNYKDRKVYMMRGHLGQYVLVVPDEDLIVVRLGHLKDKKAHLGAKALVGTPLQMTFMFTLMRDWK